MDSIKQIDYSIFIFLNNLSRSTHLEGLIFFLARYLVVVFALVILYLMTKKEKRIIYVLAATAIAFIIDQTVALFYVRQRPFVSHPEVNHLALRVTIASFPSTHAIILFSIISSLYFFHYRRWAAFLFIIGLIIITARVAAGVHYPSDVLAGALFGVLIGWFTDFYRKVKYKRISRAR